MIQTISNVARLRNTEREATWNRKKKKNYLYGIKLPRLETDRLPDRGTRYVFLREPGVYSEHVVNSALPPAYGAILPQSQLYRLSEKTIKRCC